MTESAPAANGPPPPSSEGASEDYKRKPTGTAPKLKSQKAPLLLSADQFEDWSHQFAGYLQGFNDRYRLMTEGAAVGNASYETNLYFAILYSCGQFKEALNIVSVFRRSASERKGTDAWKALEERYQQVTHSKIQGILDKLFRRQLSSETPAQFVHRINKVYHELLQTEYSFERVVTHLMMDGLSAKYDNMKQLMRMEQTTLKSIPSTIERKTQLADLYESGSTKIPTT
mgnify:FL=1